MPNPFSMTFGIEPKNYIERLKDSEQIIQDFQSDEPSNYAYMITGIRGSGKTVLLSYVANFLKNDDRWIVVDLAYRENLLENLASELYEEGKVKRLFLKTEFNFSFHGLSLAIKGDNPVTNVLTLLKKMLDLIKAKGKKCL